jgi:hypothetical protein
LQGQDAEQQVAIGVGSGHGGVLGTGPAAGSLYAAAAEIAHAECITCQDRPVGKKAAQR